MKAMSQGRSDAVVADPTASPIWLASKKVSQRNHTFEGQNHTRQGAKTGQQEVTDVEDF